MAENKEIVKRSSIHHYMDLGTEEKPKWERLGKGWSKVNENPNAQTEKTQYISDDSATTDTTGYEPNYAFECDLMKADGPIKKIYNIVKGRKTFGDCIVKMVHVDAFEETETNKECTAYLENLAVQVTSIDGEKKMKMTGSFNGQGDGIKGKFNLKTLTFTPDSNGSESSETSAEQTS